MKVVTNLIVVSLLFGIGCWPIQSQRIVLEISQMKPSGFDEHTTGLLYTHKEGRLMGDVNSLPPDYYAHEIDSQQEITYLEVGPVELDEDVFYPGGRAFTKVQYLTIEVDGKKEYMSRPTMYSTNVGTIRNPPSRIRVTGPETGPRKQPLYYILKVQPSRDHPDYWILEKGVFEVDDPELVLVIDKKKLKKPNQSAQVIP